MMPIVLLPGLLCTAEIFAPQLAALWPFGPVTVASTLEGGSLAAMADAVLASAPPHFALAGISMGGYLGFEILRRVPERVAALALLSTSARPDRPEQSAQRRAQVARARNGDFRGVVEQLPDLLLHPAHRDDPTLREVLVRMGLAVGVEAFARQQEAIIGRPDSRPGLRAISVPTLVLVGEDDPLTPPQHAEEMAAAIPQARLVQVPRCGHGSTLEQPAAVNLALAEWAGGIGTGMR